MCIYEYTKIHSSMYVYVYNYEYLYDMYHIILRYMIHDDTCQHMHTVHTIWTSTIKPR
jgi:hypothetical protein